MESHNKCVFRAFEFDSVLLHVIRIGLTEDFEEGTNATYCPFPGFLKLKIQRETSQPVDVSEYRDCANRSDLNVLSPLISLPCASVQESDISA